MDGVPAVQVPPPHTGAVESSHGIDERHDGRAAPLTRLEGGKVRATLQHQVEVFGLIQEVSRGQKKEGQRIVTSGTRPHTCSCQARKQVGPAFMAAAHKFFLLDSLRQELRTTKRQSDLGEQLRQQRVPVDTIVMDPRQRRLKHLPGEGGTRVDMPSMLPTLYLKHLHREQVSIHSRICSKTVNLECIYSLTAGGAPLGEPPLELLPDLVTSVMNQTVVLFTG